jgi:hypothetical protein
MAGTVEGLMVLIVKRLLCFTAFITLLWWGGFLCAGGLPVETNPFEIRDRIAADPGFDVAALWRELGISPELHTIYGRVGIKQDSPALFDACDNCVAEIHQVSFGPEGDGVILKAYQQRGLSRFLVFLPLQDAPADSPQWQFIGHADHDFARYHLPQHRTVILGGGHYFVMTAQGVSGTGVSLEFERWYEVTATNMKELLTLPVRGHECADGASLCRRFEAAVAMNGSTDRRVGVTFTVTYHGNRFLLDGASFEDIPLFTRRQQALFVRDDVLQDFTLSSRESGITMDEIRSVYNVGTLIGGDFIRFNTDALKDLASGPDSEARQWLAKYLLSCEPTPERDRLRGFFIR